MFIKQAPIYPRDRLKKLDRLRKTDEIKFIKQVPIYPRDRLRTKADGEELKFRETGSCTFERLVKKKKKSGTC